MKYFESYIYLKNFVNMDFNKIISLLQEKIGKKIIFIKNFLLNSSKIMKSDFIEKARRIRKMLGGGPLQRRGAWP